MKIKKGFVTNSSSTSFCCWGIKEALKITVKIQKMKGVYEYYKEKGKITISYEEYLKQPEIWKDFYSAMDELGINVGNLDDYVITGKDPGRMRDDQTLLEFKQEITNDLKIIGIDVNVKDIKFYNETVLC